MIKVFLQRDVLVFHTPPSSMISSQCMDTYPLGLHVGRIIRISHCLSTCVTRVSSVQVKDLRRELQDGTVLVELIEIVANEKIPGAHYKPSNSLEMKENVERVLQFMRSS